MAETTVYTFASGNFGVPLDAEYTSQQINRAFGAVRSIGIIRGFRLKVGPQDGEITLDVDRWAGDSVAVFRTSGGEAVWARLTASVDVDLSAHAGDTVVLALLGTYTTSTTTAMEIKAYPLSEWSSHADNGIAVPLGQVVVPNPGAVTFTLDHRKEAWSSEVVGWVPLLHNPMFEVPDNESGEDNPSGWKSAAGGSAMSATYFETGERSLKVPVVVGTRVLEPGGQDAEVPDRFPCTPGTSLMVRMRLRPQSVVDGTAQLQVKFYDKDGGDVSTATKATPTVDAQWQTAEAIFGVPATAMWCAPQFSCTGGGSAAGDHYIEAFQLFRQRFREEEPFIESPQAMRRGSSLMLSSHVVSQRYAIEFDGSGNLVVTKRSTTAMPGGVDAEFAVGKLGQDLELHSYEKFHAHKTAEIEDALTLGGALTALNGLIKGETLESVQGLTVGAASIFNGTVNIGPAAGVDMVFHPDSKMNWRVQFAGALGVGSAPDNNRQLGESNLIRAWGIVSLQGASDPLVSNGYNFSTATKGGASTFTVGYHVALPDPAGANFAVFAQHSSSDWSCNWGNADANGFDFSCLDENGNLLSDPTGFVYFMVLANSV